MTRWLVGAAALILWTSSTTHAAESAAPPPKDAVVASSAAAPSPSPTPMSRVTRQLQNRQLQLPAYARYGADAFANAPDIPAFSEEVEVFGKAMDTQSLTAKMKWWMSDFEPMNGSSGGARFYAPTLAEMREHRPSPPQAVDFKPLLGWLLGRITNKDDSSKKH